MKMSRLVFSACFALHPCIVTTMIRASLRSTQPFTQRSDQIDPKLGHSSKQSKTSNDSGSITSDPCKREADPYQFGIDRVQDQSSFFSSKRGLKNNFYQDNELNKIVLK